MIFDYPARREERRHGPQGYSRYDLYRPWLRDEFTFRCVYCLKRERWGQVTAEYELDHFQPQSVRPDLEMTYDNLVYACRRCNNVKRAQRVDDPFAVATSDCLRLTPSGELIASSPAALRLILVLDLNSPAMVQWRMLWIRIVDLAMRNDESLYRELLRFPDDLPRLERLKPPGGNSRPNGIDGSWAAISDRGELPNEATPKKRGK